MSITIEQLATPLAAEATRRGITTETLIEELVTRLDDPLEAFIGCAASGNIEPFDIHRERTVRGWAVLAHSPTTKQT